jgi:hypothetical protein
MTDGAIEMLPVAPAWKAWREALDRLEATAILAMSRYVLGQSEVSMTKENKFDVPVTTGRLVILGAAVQVHAVCDMTVDGAAHVEVPSTSPMRRVVAVRVEGAHRAGRLHVLSVDGTMYWTDVEAGDDNFCVSLPTARDIVSVRFVPREMPVREQGGYAIGFGGGGSGASGDNAASNVAIGAVLRCEHETFRYDPAAGKCGMVFCTGCALSIRAERLRDVGVHPEMRYDRKGNTLADEAQRRADELRDALADNARLRMKIERMERGKKR